MLLGKTIYCGAWRALVAVDVASDEEQWRYPTRELTQGDVITGGISSPPAGTQQAIYLLTDAGGVLVLDRGFSSTSAVSAAM